ncbi:hypothetical protein LPJ78_002676 [Coemansia sp. RSA 989]|nr:ankyrin repeat-containing domain protein [Coemansia mojavensis]KAJ1743195.1 hypothetical protein LPJ68_001199 [Coemansia sp. RSA 1086]KAJ1865502.1 hypothetical protein LPJ78_002676 [Coemansia sp. RSA 989]KAJ1872853.1 hypothetical protein LPJ55_002748 [Coemansia sp. RSA 990]KAJ2633444.1 hypothetical protein H4R22_000442 [Coemansia sp. RSA 1290]KAJ2646798.1 hypothetical protein IWW40_005158 [Coemansia sp. RSA 1250]KAJ2676564.1 hypothetical protein IWW42_000439 [Coemansia sp. RSA 1085]
MQQQQRIKKKPTANIWTAASEGDIERVKELVGSDRKLVNAKDPNGYTPLHAAASWKHLQLLKYLLDNGGDVNIVDSDGDTPLHICEDKQCAELLLKHGADMERKNKEGLTPVHTTLENEATEVTELLCARLNIPVPTLEDAREEVDYDAIPESKIEDLSKWIMEQVDDKDETDESAIKDMVTSYILKNLRVSDGERGDETAAATVASSVGRRSQDDDATTANASK